jgi:hypothetical protein
VYERSGRWLQVTIPSTFYLSQKKTPIKSSNHFCFWRYSDPTLLRPHKYVRPSAIQFRVSYTWQTIDLIDPTWRVFNEMKGNLLSDSHAVWYPVSLLSLLHWVCICNKHQFQWDVLNHKWRVWKMCASQTAVHFSTIFIIFLNYQFMATLSISYRGAFDIEAGRHPCVYRKPLVSKHWRMFHLRNSFPCISCLVATDYMW